MGLLNLSTESTEQKCLETRACNPPERRNSRDRFAPYKAKNRTKKKTSRIRW